MQLGRSPSRKESGWFATTWQIIQGPNLSLSSASHTSGGESREGSSAMAMQRTSHTSER